MAANMTDDLFFHFFLLKLKIFRGEGKILMRHTHDTTFSEKILNFFSKFRRERTVFHFIFKENGKSEAVFPQVLEDRTLSGTPQCFSYLITK
jgi:hypothetical protein